MSAAPASATAPAIAANAIVSTPVTGRDPPPDGGRVGDTVGLCVGDPVGLCVGDAVGLWVG